MGSIVQTPTPLGERSIFHDTMSWNRAFGFERWYKMTVGRP